MKKELKPCPFCGGEAGVVQYHGKIAFFASPYVKSASGYVECMKCGTRTKFHSKASLAVKKWNHRV